MKTVVVVPTYNEAENIIPLIREILNVSAHPEVLIVDDDSPDGTWRLVENEAKRNGKVHLLRRTTDRGRGLAGIEGFRRALSLGADRVVEMDADFSHDPVSLPVLIDASSSADLVIGSRYVSGGRDEDRGIARRLMSALARGYLRWVLGLSVHDPASGYRCFRREALEALLKERIKARDPFIIAETLFYCTRKGMRIVEVPIVFKNRKAGSSKLSVTTLLKYLFRALQLRLSCRAWREEPL
ncbi:MAG: polyprenol monophosphomannose synthase [Candidatus Aureabacteria bacterium]|nr:polyprenol monophosphomannose synthase [Candidatus Auribacterota bacterium]